MHEITSNTHILISILLFCSYSSIYSYYIVYRSCQRSVSIHCKDVQSELDSSRSTIGKTPYIDSLIRENEHIGDRYFFPSHTGGKFIPDTMLSLIKSHSIFEYDLPELDGLDNIHSPSGPLKASLQYVSQLFGSKKSWFLVNGSTSGIHSAILMCMRWFYLIDSKRIHKQSMKPKFIIARDSHKSVFDGLIIAQCDAILLPFHIHKDFQVSMSIRIEAIKKAILQYKGDVSSIAIFNIYHR